MSVLGWYCKKKEPFFVGSKPMSISKSLDAFGVSDSSIQFNSFVNVH